MMRIEVKVIKVDDEAFLGRNNPVPQSYLGRVGLVRAIAWEDNPSWNGFLVRALAEYDPVELKEPAGWQVFNVMFSSGRTFECMGHELQLLSATHDNDL